MSKKVLVTGSNRGLGLEFVRQWLGRGAEVYAACRQPEQATALSELAAAKPEHLTVLPLDVDDPAAVAALSAQFGITELSLLINNAGTLASGERLGQLDAEVMSSAFRTNVIGPVLLTQSLAPALTAGGGWAVNISSELGSISQRQGFFTPTYCASKAALNMWTRMLNFALGAQGAHCVAIHPGWVQTDMGGEDAPLDAASAVASMISLIEDLTPATHAGGFFDHEGSALPW